MPASSRASGCACGGWTWRRTDGRGYAACRSRGMANDPTSLRTVHLYVCDGFADWEPAYAVAGINSPAFQREPGRWRVRTVGDTGDLVRSMGGLAVLPDMPIDLLR